MVAKRLFDVVVSFVGLCLCSWLILFAWLCAVLETKSNGFFTQKRVGKNGKLFSIIKIKTMLPNNGSTITTRNDKRITKLGAFWRKTKIDELPQLINVFLGHMSLVGPRPDVPGYADKLVGRDRVVLSVRPGITGPASLKFKNEEELLAAQHDPVKYNNEVIFPEKVRINIEYVENWSFMKDIKYIYQTIFG